MRVSWRPSLALRLAAMATAMATLAAACASVSPEELAARYDGSATSGANDDGVTALPTPSTSPTDDAGSGSDVASGASPPVEALDIDSGICPFPTDGLDVKVDCGQIEFPAPAARLTPIQVSFARFRATNSAPAADAVVYLHGGPGGAVLGVADRFYPIVVEPFIADRDVIIYDQRGSGESSPLPWCPDAYDLDNDFFASATPHVELADDYVAVLQECGAELAERSDIDLSQYNSVRHAIDLAVLMASLGYDSYNIYGSSYGSRLAQTIMRDYPERVRSVIMSGVYPLDENLIGEVPRAFEAALDSIFTACIEDAACVEHLPDPWAAFDEVVAALDADPIPVEVPLSQWSAFDSLIAGDDLINAFHSLLYTADDAAMIPDTLADYLAGETGKVERIGRSNLFDIGDVAAYVAVQCHEEAPFTTSEQAARGAASATPYERVSLAPGLIGSDLISVCGGWPSIEVADAIENEPVVWDAPTLIFSGGIDPITPPWWAEQVAARLPNATLAFSADRGHDSDEGPCAAGLMTEFIADPAADLDVSCASTWTSPYLDNTPAAVRAPLTADLEPSSFSTSADGNGPFVDLSVPAWLTDGYVGEDIYWRNLDWPDQTVLIVRAGPIEPDELYFYLDVDVVGALDPADGANQVGGGWRRYEQATGGLDLVTYARGGDRAMNVTLVAYDGEISALERNVLVPVVRSVQDR